MSKAITLDEFKARITRTESGVFWLEVFDGTLWCDAIVLTFSQHHAVIEALVTEEDEADAGET